MCALPCVHVQVVRSCVGEVRVHVRVGTGGPSAPGASLCGLARPLTTAGVLSQEIVFYKVIDYILHGKEDIKVIP